MFGRKLLLFKLLTLFLCAHKPYILMLRSCRSHISTHVNGKVFLELYVKATAPENLKSY